MVQVVDDAGGMVLCGRWYTTRLSSVNTCLHLFMFAGLRFCTLLWGVIFFKGDMSVVEWSCFDFALCASGECCQAVVRCSSSGPCTSNRMAETSINNAALAAN